MSRPTIEEILAPKPDARPRIYAYAVLATCGLLDTFGASCASPQPARPRTAAERARVEMRVRFMMSS